jgi:hypothetical protein
VLSSAYYHSHANQSRWPVRYPTAHAVGLVAPQAVRAGLNLTRRSPEEVTPSRALFTGSVRVRTVEHCGVAPQPYALHAERSTGGRGASPCAWPRTARALCRRERSPTGAHRGNLAGRQLTGSVALQHEKPVPYGVRDHPDSCLTGGAARPPHAARQGSPRRTSDDDA